MKKLSSLIISCLILTIAASSVSNAQIDESFKIKLESILTKFKNYRYSTISIYRVRDIGDIRNAIRKQEEVSTRKNVTSGTDCVKNAEPSTITFVQSQVDGGKSSLDIKREMVNRGITIPDDIDCIIDALQGSGEVIPTVRNVYVVTTRMAREQLEPTSVIAMIVSFEDEEGVERNIRQVTPKNVYTNPELFSFTLDETEFRAYNMYELLMTAFRQNNIENKTLEAQGFGSFATFAPKVYGTSQSLVRNESEVTSYDVQTFIRISEGQPLDYNYVNNEIIISPDLLSWRRYELPTRTYLDGFVDTLSSVTNKTLPKFGVELKYGIDEINYPSLWSERMTLSAIWENMKLGLILPTSGWSSLTTDAFEINRKLTHGGMGISASGDFPIKVIPQSGIFNFSFGYVFGDAKESDYKNRLTDIESPNWDPIGSPQTLSQIYNEDYFIRFNTSLHYTFGIAIDDDYWLRFGIGGTTYSMERWYYKLEKNQDDEDVLNYVKKKSESIAGISAKFDFMSKNITTPYGASLQYFDESLFANIWLQIPIIRNTLSLRLDAKGYFTAFKDSPRDWENKSVFMPMARVIVTF